MNIRKALHSLIAITSLGLAPAMPIAAASPSADSVTCDDLVRRLTDGEGGLWIQANTAEWFYTCFVSGRHGIFKTSPMVLETDASGDIDARSSVIKSVCTQCRQHGLTPSPWTQANTQQGPPLMSEGFQSRWSRLKRESVIEPPSRPRAAIAPAAALAALPAIESINAESNVSAFLQPGVPDELTRLALHTAWMSDPEIRDFVGIAENQWDFNSEGAIAGFGSLTTEEYARHLAARARLLLGRL